MLSVIWKICFGALPYLSSLEKATPKTQDGSARWYEKHCRTILIPPLTNDLQLLFIS